MVPVQVCFGRYRDMKKSVLLILIVALVLPGTTYADPVTEAVDIFWSDVVSWIETLVADIFSDEQPDSPKDGKGSLPGIYDSSDPAGIYGSSESVGVQGDADPAGMVDCAEPDEMSDCLSAVEFYGGSDPVG